ncbi:acetyl-CoA carboxylase biotin carboxylase subunit [Coxiella endosymbiont of Ornithodoros amblus]|uniref:acetyl/propionyl/methylcrotonyl-CoA carboxylase subunit alpha n=1 Tax=Coxiella endosymbiont of Ornithodoros amblus TaxID=1656166 RepID=UPI00244E4A87|nr:acetyl-CoA carboxylase biotin carboxylase subunit [Coxiella endosymbiont of Ornithodoros amblus]MBW5803086.1 acetyl-CoA carboxylase biotin carboxylase subunit [Coxiella endosymbiont of Ornithodoros amblus]
MFRKLIIANRGEITCRIIKTAKKWNIRTVALYSTIDKSALHVRLADESYLIGPPPAAKSYLNREKIINIAMQTNADAIHPGYGFLAEDEKFAALCHQKGLTFIGPPPAVIAAMGDKREAKCLMKKASVPVVPGYQEKQQDLKTLTEQAKKIGFPLLIKASAGGGGKGMRLVTIANELEQALQSAKREAKSSFDDDSVFLEKYINPARHIEVQIFIDQKGNGAYLFDRDCSIQRRHQKIIEEAPAPSLSDLTRKKMGETALKAAKAVNYVGAGTVEFLVDKMENFYFMEMNTRLQVEHPVTEMITGLDLVEWQLKIAQGEILPLSQKQIKAKGHAFEARLYSEDPANNFSPSSGKIVFFSSPKENKNVRLDTGVVQGDTISPYYDPLMAKLIVHDENRSTALKRLKTSLENTFIVGVNTNISFLHQICTNRDFKKANIYTTLIEETSLNKLEKIIPNEVLFFSALAELQQQKKQAKEFAAQSDDLFSPWFARDGWRLSICPSQTLRFWDTEKTFDIKITPSLEGCNLLLNNEEISLSQFQQTDHLVEFTYNNQNYKAFVINDPDNWHIFYKGNHFTIARYNPKTHSTDSSTIENQFIASIPGTVIEIFVTAKQNVKKGDHLLILETMKMEHTITAPKDGVVKSVFCRPGDIVSEGTELLSFF